MRGSADLFAGSLEAIEDRVFEDRLGFATDFSVAGSDPLLVER